MLRFVRANSIGFLALFVALGGTGYAAFKLPKHSVANRALKTGAVNSRVVKNHSITASDLARGVVRTGRAGATGAQGLQGAKGDKGDLGPTEGGSRTDAPPSALAGEGVMDQSNFTTRNAGRLLVSKTVNDISANCSAGTWVTWLEVDGVRVPGTTAVVGPTGTHAKLLTLTGVTDASLAAGPHTLAFGLDCVGGNTTGWSSTSNTNATYVVLGNG